MRQPTESAAETPTQAQPVLRATGLHKSYPAFSAREQEVKLFRDLDLEIAAGEMVAVIGRSGSGKSSLLHLLAGLDRPSAGEVWVGSTALHSLPAQRLAEVRNRSIGYVWQFHYLLPEFTATENVAMPLLARGVGGREANAQARAWLSRVDLLHRAEHRSGELSGGEQQRIAIARALITSPAVLLADEPTGDLDAQTASTLLDLLQSLCREGELGALLVTHSAAIASRCDRVLQLHEGRLQPVASNPDADLG